MWHEARKQEKKIRGLMVDYKRRAERRREFYEKIKLDPAQFVRVFGQSCKVNLDPAIAVAAESPQSMMPWQGDTSNMIDRFDVRAHLDIMPPEKSYTPQLTKAEEDIERKANYESYRIIVENECAGLTEEQALQQLYFDELYGAVNKDAEEDKTKLKDKKAAIGYVYEDSTKEEEEEDSDSDESEKEDIETLDLDIALDIDALTTDQMDLLNVCGTQFGMGKNDFINYLRRDKDDSEALKQAKLLEEEKAQFAGRKSRRERRLYKEKRLAGRTLSPPSYAARDSPKYEPYRRSSSRSKSRSRSPPRKTRKMYITSFGENDDSDEGMGVMQGPELPPGLGTNQESEKKTEATCDSKKKSSSRGSRSSERSKSHSYRRSWSRSREYRSRRSRSRGYRSRSHERRSRNGRDIRSRSRDLTRRSRDRYSSDRSRRRSSDRFRSRRSRSRSRNSRSRDRRSVSSRHNRTKSYSRSKSRSRSRRSSMSSLSSSSTSRSRSRSSRSKSRSPVKPVLKSYRRESLSSNSDSESDSDDKHKASSDDKHKASSSKSWKPTRVGPSKPSVVFGISTNNSQRLTPQEKLKRKMQLALTKQYKADKKAEILKQEKLEQEKLDREEELRIRALEMRRKEREKRHQDHDDYSDDESSRGSSPPRTHRENKSPFKKSKKDDDRPKKYRSKSRSRSRTPERRRPTHHKRIGY